MRPALKQRWVARTAAERHILYLSKAIPSFAFPQRRGLPGAKREAATSAWSNLAYSRWGRGAATFRLTVEKWEDKERRGLAV